MKSLEAFLTFMGITFPILLLVPSLITSFRKILIPIVELGIFFGVLWADYIFMAIAAFLLMYSKGLGVGMAFLIISALLGIVALFFISKWTTHEQIQLTIEKQRIEMKLEDP